MARYHMTFTLYDIAWFLLFCLAMTVGIFLIIFINNFNQLVKNAKKVIETNEANIGKTFKDLPQAVDNFNSLTIDIRSNIDKAGSAIDALGGTITETAAAVGEKTENVFSFIQVASGVVRIILDLLDSGKKDK